MRTRLISSVLVVLSAISPGALAAQERAVPYWASIRADTVNMRVGPGTDYPIDWIYRRPGLPVKVVRVMQGWRLVRDPDGTQGWIVGRLLTRERGALVVGEDLAPMRARPSAEAELLWNVEPGVVGMLGDCENGWCEFDVGGRSGWIEAARIWGDGEP